MHGFDYLSLHWADKQKPLEEVTGEFGVFPEEVWSPPLVPQEIDEATPVSVTEVTLVATAESMVECVRVTEHFLAIEYVPVRVPDRRSRPRMAAAEPIA